MTKVTNPEEIWNKCSDNNKKKPWLVISVIGDSNSFVPTTWEKALFQTSLIETAKGAKECWILYKGDKGKLSESIRQAVDNLKMRHKAQMSKRSKGKKMLEMWRNSDMPNIKLISINTATEKSDNKENNFEVPEDKYTEICVELLKKIGKQRVQIMKLQQNLTIRIPVVVMVAEGDIKTIRHVEQILKEGLPIVIVKGSGKAADVISGYLRDGKDVLKERAPLLLGTYTQHDEYSKLEEQMKSIKDRSHLISIFNVNDTTQQPLSDITTEAILRSWARGERGSVNKEDKRQELTTNMQSNNAFEPYPMLNLENIAKFEQDNSVLYQDADLSHKPPTAAKPIVQGIFLKGDTIANEVVEPGSISRTIIERQFKNWLTPSSFPLYFFIAYQLVQLSFKDEPDKYTKNFQDLLEKAIEADKIDYVTVLLHEHDVLFNKDDLPELYEQTVKCRLCEQSVDCQHLSSILKTYKKISKKLFSLESTADDRKEAGRDLCRHFLHYPKEEASHEMYPCKDEISISHDLLIWSLFAHRPQLATLFWKTSENQLLTALLVTGVLKRMSVIAKEIADQSVYEDLKEHSRIFEKRAFDMQNFMYKEHPAEAMELMTTEFRVWDISISPLQCAYDNDLYEFIALPCAQRCLNKIWYNELGTNFSAAVKKGLGCRKNQEGSPFCSLLAAPFTKFVVNYIIFMLAIITYSAFLLTNITVVENIGMFEILVYIWLVADMIEEYLIPKFQTQKPKTFKKADRWYRFRRYINDFWNVLDTVSYIITFIAIALRFSSETLQWARRIYSFSLFMMCMRFLHFILIYRKVGVYVILIKEMMRDLARFFVILIVFMMAVGVMYHINMYPNHDNMWPRQGVQYWRIWKIINLPYWQIYGEIFMDSIDGTDNSSCTNQKEVYENNPDIERCIEYDWILLVIAALYMLLSNLLLVNLVIALFSARFEKVRSNSEKIWRYTRYSYIMDYRLRLPAVLNLLLRPIMFIIWVADKCKCCKNKVDEGELEQQANYKKHIKTLQTMCSARCT